MPRRPGERREPLSTRVCAALVAAAARRGLEPDCAAELCLERALVIADLAALGRAEFYEQLLALAERTTLTLPLPGAKADYLQMLLASRGRQQVPGIATGTALETIVNVPLRLFPRVADIAYNLASSGEEELVEALALEIGAVSEGRTMSEWAALAALRLSR
jgi:hypothetical protein